MRTMLSCLAIILSVSFFAGTLVYADTARAAFADEFARPGRGVDVAVHPPTATGYDPDGLLDPQTLGRIQALPGVAEAEGRTVTRLPVLDHHGRALSNAGRAGFAVSLPREPRLAPFDLVAGTLPNRPGDAVLDTDTARRLSVPVGGSLQVLDRRGERRDLRVVGIVDFGSTQMFSGWSVVGLGAADLADLTQARGYATIVVAAEAGTDLSGLRDAVAAVAGGPVITGDELRANLGAGSAKYVQGFVDVLFASSLVALVIAVLVVVNTFTILLAQRTRELALLRVVGASRTSVFGLVAAEAAVAGLVASAAGVAVSLGVARLIFAGRDLFGAAEPGHALVVTPTAVLAGLAAGTLSTTIAACPPALAATRIAPLAALRASDTPAGSSRGADAPDPATDAPDTAADATGSASGRRGAPGRRLGRTAVPFRATLAVAVCLAGLGIGASGTGSGFDGTTWVLAGAMIVLVGVVVVLPLVIAPLTRQVGWLPTRLFGVPAGLAVRNAQRNPRRVAATTTALMIGATLVSLFAVVFATSRDQAGRELAENFPVDFSVRPVAAGTRLRALPDELANDLRKRPEFGAVVRSHIDLLWIGDEQPITMSALEPGQTAFAPEVMAGSLDALGPGRAAVRRGYAAAHDIGIGDRLNGRSYGGQRYQATVVVLFDDAPIEGELLVDWADFYHLSGEYGDQILIRRSAGTAAADARAALDTVLASFPLTSVTSQAERGETLATQLQRRLAQFGVLLGISIAIAIFGIGNTLALSVWERTRESAILRVLGMARRQLSAMLMVESILMAVIGAGLGVVLGVTAGWFTATSLITVYGHGSPTIPVVPLLGFVLLSALAAVLASLLPARRAHRTDLISVLH